MTNTRRRGGKRERGREEEFFNSNPAQETNIHSHTPGIRPVTLAQSASRRLTLSQLLFFMSLWLGMTCVVAKPTLGLPPPGDVPEEVLRTEIITEARSPIDGKPLTAAEYAQLKAQLADRSTPVEINPKFRQLIFLLNIRHFLRTITPF